VAAAVDMAAAAVDMVAAAADTGAVDMAAAVVGVAMEEVCLKPCLCQVYSKCISIKLLIGIVSRDFGTLFLISLD
jgi:hypothetical protein